MDWVSSPKERGISFPKDLNICLLGSLHPADSVGDFEAGKLVGGFLNKVDSGVYFANLVAGDGRGFLGIRAQNVSFETVVLERLLFEFKI